MIVNTIIFCVLVQKKPSIYVFLLHDDEQGLFYHLQ